jgi:signal transduction histidine kinase
LPIKNRFFSKGINFRGYSIQLFLLVIIPLTILLLIVAFGSQTLHYEAMRSLVGDRDLVAVRAASNSIEREITHRSSMIMMLARGLIADTNLSNLIIPPDEIHVSFDGGIALFNSNGGLITATNLGDYWEKINTILPDYFDSVRKNDHNAVFSQRLITQDPNNFLILVGIQTVTGNILIGAFTPRSIIQDTVTSTFNSEKTMILVVSRSVLQDTFDILFQAGSILPVEKLDIHPGFQNALDGEIGINYYKTDGGEHIVAFSPIRPIGWGLVTEEAWEDVASPFLRTTQAAPLILVPVFLLAIVALWIGTRRIVQPLQSLERQASELAQGNFKAIHKLVGGIGEIRNLQEELIVMADKLQSAQHSLRSYIGAITTGIENERYNLARELHDETIQDLIALNQRIQLAQLYKVSETDKKTFDELQKIVQQSIADLRRVVRGLRPIYLEDFGISAALEMLAKESAQIGNWHSIGYLKRLLIIFNVTRMPKWDQ